MQGPPGGWVQSADVLHVLNTERYAERAAAMSRLLANFGGVSGSPTNGHLRITGSMKKHTATIGHHPSVEVPRSGFTGACCAW